MVQGHCDSIGEMPRERLLPLVKGLSSMCKEHYTKQCVNWVQWCMPAVLYLRGKGRRFPKTAVLDVSFS